MLADGLPIQHPKSGWKRLVFEVGLLGCWLVLVSSGVLVS